MVYLKRLSTSPGTDDLTSDEARYIQQHFDSYAGEVLVNSEPVPWNAINEVEVVKSPRAAGPAGWIVRHIIHGGERYHVGIYYGQQEAVLPNVTANIARHILQAIAYYAPRPVLYNGPEGLAAVTPSA